MALIGKDIDLVASLLKDGKVVAIPTETVYGLAANAFNEKAVLKIFEVKNRPTTNPLIVHIGNKMQLTDLVKSIPENAHLLMENFWPGPLTLLLPKKAIVSDLVTASHNTVAIRMPSHPLLQELLKKISFPLTAPSANPFTYISPTTVDHVSKQIGTKIPYILDGGDCQKGVESTIVGFNKNGDAIIYRLGAITTEALEVILQSKLKTFKNNKSTPAPGMMKIHYAPSTPLYLVDNLKKNWNQFKEKNIALIVFDKEIKGVNSKNQFILSKNSSLDEATENLYKSLHYFDNKGFDAILIQKFENKGLGKTLNDRLSRAQVKF